MWIKLGLCLHLTKRSALPSTPWWNISKEKSTTKNAATEITPRSGVAFFVDFFSSVHFERKGASKHWPSLCSLRSMCQWWVYTLPHLINLFDWTVSSFQWHFHSIRKCESEKTLTHFAQDRNKTYTSFFELSNGFSSLFQLIYVPI